MDENKQIELFKYFMNDENRLTYSELSELCDNKKSGTLAETTFKCMYPELNYQECFSKKYRFDFTLNDTIIEIKNYMYESTGTADQKLAGGIIHYITAMKESKSKYKRLIFVLCAKFEQLYKNVYEKEFKTSGFIDLMQQNNIHIVFMSDLIKNFYLNENEMSFIKWVGGKSKLLQFINPKIIPHIRPNITYIEPFIGSGSVLINILKYTFTNGTIDKIKFFVNDINEELIITYEMIKEHVDLLIYALNKITSAYYSKNNINEQEKMYYELRDRYNEIRDSLNIESQINAYDILGDYELIDLENIAVNEEPTVLHYNLFKACVFIFMNKAGFRGMYRVNSDGEFNVPFGNYKRPSFIDENELIELNNLFKYVTFYNEDYKTFLERFNDENERVIYLDPPYYGTFNNYSSTEFSHSEFMKTCERLMNEQRQMNEQQRQVNNSKATNETVNEATDKSANETVQIPSLHTLHLVVSNSEAFYNQYKNKIDSLFNVECVNTKDRINSKAPESIRKEVILTSKNNI